MVEFKFLLSLPKGVSLPLPFHLLQDGHEICFVGDEAFRELSKVDPDGDKLLDDVSILFCVG